MAVPTQDQLHRPILEFLSEVHDVDAVPLNQIKEMLIEHFNLTEIDMEERIPSGVQTRFDNRCYWATSYLKRAKLVHSPSRARFHITQHGREFLATHKGEIARGELNSLIEAGYQNPDTQPLIDPPDLNTVSATIINSVSYSEDVTPDEQMVMLYHELKSKLADELLDAVKDIPPDSFERLVVRLLEKMGYGEGRSVGRSSDGGIDGIINQDALGLEKVYIQAKRWQNIVGEPEIRNFSGSLDAKGASKGVFITTSAFSSTASQTAQVISNGPKFIRLINGPELASLMISHGVGVITEITYEVKKIDENYFVDL